MRPITSMGYTPYNLTATQRAGANLPKPLTEVSQPVLRGMDAMLAKEEADLRALKAKPVKYKLHQANEATRPVREAVQGVFKWIKDAATGKKFQLFTNGKIIDTSRNWPSSYQRHSD